MKYGDRFLRHEQKYLITLKDYYMLRSLLSACMEPDENATDGGYFIRSLYFDDIYDSAYVEKDAGVKRRRKHRIRIYNCSKDVIKYEIKDKFDDYISKLSATITPQQCVSMINENFDFMLDSDNSTLRSGFIDARCGLLRPKVIVDYDREVYVCEEGNVRITFDMNLAAGLDSYDIFDPEVITVSAMEPNMMILEVKYDDFLPEYIRRVLRKVDKRPTAVSKYVLCRQAKEIHYRREIPYESVYTRRPVKLW